MVEVKFYDKVDDELLKFAVIIARSNGKWVFCKHKKRNTYEIPGGHRENETDSINGWRQHDDRLSLPRSMLIGKSKKPMHRGKNS